MKNNMFIIWILILILISCQTTSLKIFYPVEDMGERQVFIDKVEVSNFSYKEYLLDLKERYGETADIFLTAFPSNDVWSKAYEANFKLNFGEKYDDFPIVGLTKDQMEDYCDWRSTRLSSKFGKNFKCRLPTVEEWEKVTANSKKQSFSTLRSVSKMPKKPIYLNSNVSELTKGGIIVGGNYLNPDFEIQNYTGSTAWLGFRCITILNM